MTDEITAYGRVRGEIKYTYGPKHFDKDWNGLFTAMEIIDLAGILEGDPPMPGKEAGESAQNLAKRLILKNLQLTLGMNTKLNALLISARTTHWYKADEISSKFLKLSSDGDERIRALTRYLSSIDLNTWGVLRQISLALGEFENQESDGDSMNFFFTL